jgi:hypothetical protein
MLLGTFGPAQTLIIFIIPIGLIIGLVLLFTSRAKHKARAEVMKEMLDREQRKNDQKEEK